jgi:hypothetical protein
VTTRVIGVDTEVAGRSHGQHRLGALQASGRRFKSCCAHQQPVPRGGNDRTIAVTCQIHGARGFCNLRLTKVGGDIVLDPHVACSCVLTFDEAAAHAGYEVFREWLV